MLDSGKYDIVRRLVQILIRVLALRPTFQRRMSKKKWSEGIDLRPLSGEEWLRLLFGETNMAALVGWCENCRVGECSQQTCQRCGAALLKFDEQFWSQIGRKIRRAMRKDRALLPRVKSERESLYGMKRKQTFPPPLDWLNRLWEQASQPPRQSFDPQIHYQVANWVESLRRLGLSKEEIIDVLSTGDFQNGQVKREGKDYAKIPGEDLRKLGEDFRRAVGYVPGSALDLSEMWRTMTWVDRQRTVPMARLRGERVRKRNPVRVRSGHELREP
jgi:hypothetical protein